MSEQNIYKQIEQLISENEIVLFMKGIPEFPQCGFSSSVVTILKKLDVKFVGINVLENPELRQAIKEYSDWPTIPQLYIRGEFIGGSDIVRELYTNGELKAMLEAPSEEE